MYRRQRRRVSKEDVRQWKIFNSQLPDPRGFAPRMMGYTFNYDTQKWEPLLPELLQKPPRKPAVESPAKVINVKEKNIAVRLLESVSMTVVSPVELNSIGTFRKMQEVVAKINYGSGWVETKCCVRYIIKNGDGKVIIFVFDMNNTGEFMNFPYAKSIYREYRVGDADITKRCGIKINCHRKKKRRRGGIKIN